MSKTHELKCWPEYFRAIREGRKPFELRKDDRDFQVGDALILHEYVPGNATYTGHKEFRDITYVLRGAPGWGLADGYCILGLAPA